MEYLKIQFCNGFLKNRSGLEKSVEEMLHHINPICRFAERCWKPQMDMYETRDEVILCAEIAGVRKENLEIEVSNNAINISGKRTMPPALQGARYRVAEIQYGIFKRTLFLPFIIIPEKTKALYTNGLLQIHLYKTSPGVTRIPIQEE
jgi:HSP20 family protein